MTFRKLTFIDAADAKAHGWIVDTCCSPWVAYQGPRFQPTAWGHVPTDLEAELRRRVDALEHALQPFAAEADEWSEKVGDRYRPGVTEPRKQVTFAKAVYSLGDLRRARRLLRDRA